LRLADTDGYATGDRLASAGVTDESPDPTDPADHDVDPPVARDLPDAVPELDLDAVEDDLAAVETALQRLSDGTYWVDEVTGEPIPEHVLTADPTARRA
jgi:RNA polymerase-binding transcription factor DksA